MRRVELSGFLEPLRSSFKCRMANGPLNASSAVSMSLEWERKRKRKKAKRSHLPLVVVVVVPSLSQRSSWFEVGAWASLEAARDGEREREKERKSGPTSSRWKSSFVFSSRPTRSKKHPNRLFLFLFLFTLRPIQTNSSFRSQLWIRIRIWKRVLVDFEPFEIQIWPTKQESGLSGGSTRAQCEQQEQRDETGADKRHATSLYFSSLALPWLYTRHQCGRVQCGSQM